MKILVGIPVITGADHCARCFDSVGAGVGLLIIDNNADPDVKTEIKKAYLTKPYSYVICNPVNNYVNPAWNQILKYFLTYARSYDQLVIMNSDLIMNQGWHNHLIDGISCIPTDGSHPEDVEVTEGTPGVFIHLNRQMAELVYPIPETLKVWFGDNWIYENLRKAGYKTIIKSKLIAHHYHGGSQTIARVPEISQLIEEDKKQWNLLQQTTK